MTLTSQIGKIPLEIVNGGTGTDSFAETNSFVITGNTSTDGLKTFAKPLLTTISTPINATGGIPQGGVDAPLITQGTQIWAQTVTPRLSTSKLKISYCINMDPVGLSFDVTVPIFLQGTNTAINTHSHFVVAFGSAIRTINGFYIISSENTNSRIYQINVSSVTVNPVDVFGSVKSDIIVEEILA